MVTDLVRANIEGQFFFAILYHPACNLFFTKKRSKFYFTPYLP